MKDGGRTASDRADEGRTKFSLPASAAEAIAFVEQADLGICEYRGSRAGNTCPPAGRRREIKSFRIIDPTQLE
jgi:hypothetical protein